MIFCFEGIDGSGKATQTKLLAERLRSHYSGIAHPDDPPTFAFPNYNSPTGALIKKMLSEGFTSVDDAIRLQSLMIADRLARDRLWQKRDPHSHVILDRCHLSGIVYGQIDGIDRDWLVSAMSQLTWPDITFVLDINVETSMARRPKRRDVQYEANQQKLSLAAGLYRDEVRNNDIGRCVRLATGRDGLLNQAPQHYLIDGDAPPERIHDAVWSVVVNNIL